MSKLKNPPKFTRDDYIRIYERDGYKCQAEGCNNNIVLFQGHIAHCIAKSIANRLKYGDDVIFSDHNVLLTCGEACNASVNIGSIPSECDKIVEKVRGE